MMHLYSINSLVWLTKGKSVLEKFLLSCKSELLVLTGCLWWSLTNFDITQIINVIGIARSKILLQQKLMAQEKAQSNYPKELKAQKISAKTQPLTIQ